MDTDEVTDLLDELWAAVGATVAKLDEAGYAAATRARGWSVRDLLFHVLLDAQRALVAMASPASAGAVADVDAVSYWTPFRPSEGDGGRAHAAFVRTAASAYSSGRALAEHWDTTWRAAARAVRAADPAYLVETQGHVIPAGDLASTLVVEATVHLLDLTLGVDGPSPSPAALRHTRGVLEALYGAPLPAAWVGWGDTEAVLRGTGRLPADDPRLPLLG